MRCVNEHNVNDNKLEIPTDQKVVGMVRAETGEMKLFSTQGDSHLHEKGI